MRYIIFLMILISCSGYSLTTGWNDCSTTLYSWPYGFEKYREVVEILSNDILINEIELASRRKERAKNDLPKKPNLKVNPNDISKEEIATLIEQSRVYIDSANAYHEMVEYRDVDHARFTIAYQEFVETGEAIVKGEDLQARFMSSTFTSCTLDAELMKKIISSTLINLEKKYAK